MNKKNNTPGKIPPARPSSPERLFIKRMQAMRLVMRAPEPVLDSIIAMLPIGEVKHSP